MLKTLIAVFFCCLPLLAAVRTLDIYFIDVEGGQATLVVSPNGQGMLFDTGWPGFHGRDAKRIVAVANLAGLKAIDYVLVTHYHVDHAGGVPNLIGAIPVKSFIDHGPSVEITPDNKQLVADYTTARAKARHLVARPGLHIPIQGIDVQILTAAGEQISTPIPGVRAASPICSTVKPKDADPSENARSIGSLITYGKFRMVDLGDLTWNKEYALACPVNLVGPVDLYLTTHHGLNQSNNPALVDELRPRVSIMNNGATKGGSPEAWQTVHNAKGLQDLWQLHYSEEGGTSNNVEERFIANPDAKSDAANYIRVSALADGTFTVTNSRNGFSKTYRP